MEDKSPKVESRTSLLFSHEITFHIGPLPLLVYGVLSSGIYGTYCAVQSNVCTANSLFVRILRMAKPKQNLSLIGIFKSKLNT